MFIFVTEGGEVYRSEICTDEDKASADAGVVHVIDTLACKEYYDGEWHHIEKWPNN